LSAIRKGISALILMVNSGRLSLQLGIASLSSINNIPNNEQYFESSWPLIESKLSI